MKPNELIKKEVNPRSSGIYAIICKNSNKCYIGKSINIYRRWTSHKEHLRKGAHCNIHLQRAWDKYGKEAFEFIVLELCGKDVLGQKEIEWTTNFDIESLFNQGNIGGYLSDSEETKIRRSKAQKRKWESSEFRDKMSKVLTGRKMPEGFSEKISRNKKGKKLSKDHIEKVRNSLKGKPLSLKNKLGLLKSRKRLLTIEQADQIRLEFCDGKSVTELSNGRNVSIYIISNIVRGVSYILDCNKEIIERAKLKCGNRNQKK